MLLAPPGLPCRVSCAAPKLAAPNSAAAAVVANKNFLDISVLLCVDHFDPRRPETTKTTIDGSPFFRKHRSRLFQRRCKRKLNIPILELLTLERLRASRDQSAWHSVARPRGSACRRMIRQISS